MFALDHVSTQKQSIFNIIISEVSASTMAQIFRFFCFCIVLLGSYHFQTTARSTSTPLPPSEDPWYRAPENFEATTPGHILRFREAPGDLCSIVANCSRAFNVIYRTTDNNDNASWAVTTLLAPHRNVSERPNRALLSYQIPIDSPDIDQQPSYILYAPNSTELYLDFTGALGRGWFVSVPDYEGPLAAFGAPHQEGQATLDSVRAILRLAKDHPEIGLSPSDDIRYALWGYSGGSIASEWAAELQPTYAPELDFAGAIFGGLVPSFRTVFDEIDGTPFMGNLPAFMVGVTAQAPEARNFLLSKLKDPGPYNASIFLSVLNMSVAEDFDIKSSRPKTCQTTSPTGTKMSLLPFC